MDNDDGTVSVRWPEKSVPVASWVPDHPFTDGSGSRPSFEVFGGFVAAEALTRQWAAEHVRARELGSAKVNPFLWRFRLSEGWLETDEPVYEGEPSVQLADLGLLFASLQARLSRGEWAHLWVDAEDEPDGTRRGATEIEIVRYVGV